MEHPTAETKGCYEDVFEALTNHFKARLNYKASLEEWQKRVKEAPKATKANWENKKPMEPTPKDLKTALGTALLSKFPFMSCFRHMYKNLLQVTLVLCCCYNVSFI